jgi:spore coat protein H
MRHRRTSRQVHCALEALGLKGRIGVTLTPALSHPRVPEGRVTVDFVIHPNVPCVRLPTMNLRSLWLLLTCLLIPGAKAEPSVFDLAGRWEGTVELGKTKFKLVVNVAKLDEQKVEAKVTILDQETKEVPITASLYNYPAVRWEVDPFDTAFNGKMNETGTEIAGRFEEGQVGRPIPVVFRRAAAASQAEPPRSDSSGAGEAPASPRHGQGSPESAPRDANPLGPRLACAPKSTNAIVAADALFTTMAVPHIQIDVSEDGMKTLRKQVWQPGHNNPREAVAATVRDGQNVYTNVALHLKGAAGSFRPVDDRPALTLNFDRFASGQHFHGLTKLSLNNSVQDQTLVSEQLARELFVMAGVPVPRAGHATVELNGRDLGLYVLTEGWDRAFLKRHFKNSTGHLYDGGFIKDVTDELALNSGDDPKNQSDRVALAQAAQEKNSTNRLARLEKVLDLERFLSFIALEVMLWHWDGYAMNRNNWRLYHDLDKGRMVFLPHGLDQLFGNPEGSILPPMEGLVAKAVLQIPELRQRYFQRMKELRASVFEPEAMTNRAYALAARFQPLLQAKDPDMAKQQENALRELCDAIMRRGEVLDQQLTQPIELLTFDEHGVARPRGWKTRADFGSPVLSKQVQPSEQQTLEIRTAQGSSIGSWRTRVWLEHGRYRLEGRIKTQGVVADPGDPRGGAGLRTGKSRPEKYLLGDVDWKPVQHEFAVDDALLLVQLVCEFRGTEGRAWFDQESLRITKAPP